MSPQVLADRGGDLLQKLETLDVRDSAITDSGVRALAAGLPLLRCLNLEHCVKARAR